MIRAALAVAVVAIVRPTIATADPTTADALGDEAKALAAAGQHRQAAKKYAEASRQDPTRATLFCNIGVSYLNAGDAAQAYLLLDRCLERPGLEAEFVAKVREALAALEATLRAGGHTPVRLDLKPRDASVAVVEFGPESEFVGPRTVWLPFGSYHLAVSARGFVTKQIDIATSSTEDKPLAVELAPEIHDVKVDQPPAKREVRWESGSKLPPAIATAATVGLAVVVPFANRAAKARAKDAPFALDNNEFQNDRSRVKMWNAVTVAATTLAAAGAVASGYLWYRATRKRQIVVETAVDSRGATLSISRFF